MSYIPKNLCTLYNNHKIINLDIILDTNQNSNQQNKNIDLIQEQFKRMSERHKRKKMQEQQKQNEIKEETNIKKEEQEKKKEIKKNDYIHILYSEDDIQIRQKNSLLNLIFERYTLTYIEYKNHKLKLRSLLTSESEQSYKDASCYSEDQFYSMYQLFVLSYALIEVDDYIFNNHNECLEFLYQLPYIDINKLYNTFYEDILQQNQTVNNISHFYDLIHEPFFRMKYKVMRAFHCLPTEERCKQMNDAQWLWLYYNLEEDMFEHMDEKQDNLDYLGFYLNSDAAKKVMKHNQDYRRKRDQKRKERFKKIDIQYQIQNNTTDDKKEKEKKQEQTASQKLDNFFTAPQISNDNTVYSTAFEQELAAAIGTTDISQFTEISDDNEAGNALESEEDFMERVKTFAQFAGTNYGYIKPEKPPKLSTKRRDNYMPESNAENIHETRIQRYLRNTLKKQQIQNSNTNSLPIQTNYMQFAKENNKTQQEKNIQQKTNFHTNNLPIQNKQLNPKEIKTHMQQQIDREFMQKMGIKDLSEMDKFKTMQEDNKNLDSIIEDE